MRENETKENQGKFTVACDAPNLDKDHERLIRIRDAVIDSSKEVNLFNALGAKDDIEQILATECEKNHMISCNGKSEDERHKLMRVETLENEKIYDAYEIACLMDSNRLCSDLVSSLIRLIGGTNSHYVSKDIYEKSQIARKAVEDLAIELGISIRNIEDGLK